MVGKYTKQLPLAHVPHPSLSLLYVGRNQQFAVRRKRNASAITVFTGELGDWATGGSVPPPDGTKTVSDKVSSIRRIGNASHHTYRISPFVKFLAFHMRPKIAPLPTTQVLLSNSWALFRQQGTRSLSVAHLPGPVGNVHF